MIPGTLEYSKRESLAVKLQEAYIYVTNPGMPYEELGQSLLSLRLPYEELSEFDKGFRRAMVEEFLEDAEAIIKLLE